MKKILTGLYATMVVIFVCQPAIACDYSMNAAKTMAFASDDYHDGSFRENIYQGMKNGSKDSGWLTTNDNSTSTYMRAYRTYFAYGTQTIVAAGSDQKSAVQMSSQEFQDKKYILVDEKADWKSSLKNYTGIYFNVEQAAFLTGYLTGLALSENTFYKSEKSVNVSGWGGADYPGVNNYLVGYRQGIDYWNYKNPNSMHLNFILFDPKNRNNNFSGGWAPGANNAKDLAIARGLINNQNVKVLLPVAASQIETALNVIQNLAKGDAYVIGVDADQTKVYPSQKKMILSSIIKNSIVSVRDAVKAVNDINDKKWISNYAGKTYYASIANQGVSYVGIDGIKIPDAISKVANKAKDETTCDWANSSKNWCDEGWFNE